MSDTITRRGRHVATLTGPCDGGCGNEPTQTSLKHGYRHRDGRLALAVCHLCDDCVTFTALHMDIAVIGSTASEPYPVRTPRHRADEPLDRLVSLLNSPAAFDRHMATLRDLDQAGHFPEFGEEG